MKRTKRVNGSGVPKRRRKKLPARGPEPAAAPSTERRKEEVTVTEVEALRMEASTARFEMLVARAACAREQLAHAETLLRVEQERHGRVLSEMQSRGPSDHLLVGFDSKQRQLLFAHKDEARDRLDGSDPSR